MSVGCLTRLHPVKGGYRKLLWSGYSGSSDPAAGTSNFVKVVSRLAATATDDNLSSSISVRAPGTSRCKAKVPAQAPQLGDSGPSNQTWMPRENLRELYAPPATRADEGQAGHRNTEAFEVGSAAHSPSISCRWHQLPCCCQSLSTPRSSCRTCSRSKSPGNKTGSPRSRCT